MSAVAEFYGAPIAVGLAAVLSVVAALVFYASSPQLRRMDVSIGEAMAKG